jgi:biopolymer transport protein TolR
MRRIRRKPMADINVVPYIDVMLVLLVIFMVTAPILSQGVVVDLPQQANKAIPAKQKEPIVVSIDARGHMYLNIAKHPEHVIDTQTMKVTVHQALAHAKGRAIMVKADRMVKYDVVMKAMSALQYAGASTVGLVTESNDDND